MQSTNDKVLKKWKNILSILLAVLLMNQGIVAEAAPEVTSAGEHEDGQLARVVDQAGLSHDGVYDRLVFWTMQFQAPRQGLT